MEKLPSIAEEVSQTLEYYMQFVEEAYPEVQGTHKNDCAEEFLKAWLKLQTDRGMLLYYRKKPKKTLVV